MKLNLLYTRSTTTTFLMVIVPVILCLLVMLILFSRYRDHKISHAYLDKQVELIGGNYNEILANPLWNINDRGMQQVLDAIQSNPDVAGTAVVDDTNALFGSTGILSGLTYDELLELQKNGDKVNKHFFFNHFFRIGNLELKNSELSTQRSNLYFPTDSGLVNIGSFFFVLTITNYSKQFSAQLFYDVVYSFILSVVLIVVLMFVYTRTTSIPLQKLHEVILDIQQGKEQAIIDWKGDNEIGRAILAFNELQVQQLGFKKDLELARDTLENRVQDLQVRTAELEESENRFAILLEQVPNIGVRGYGPDGTIHYWNKANETIYGYTQEEAIGQNLKDLIIPSDNQKFIFSIMTQGIQGGTQPFHGELQVMQKGGALLHVYSSQVVVQRVQHDPIVFSLDLDLSDRKKLEEELIQAHKMEAIGTLAGGIAHDFNNILAIIIFYANLAIEDLPADSDIGTDIDKIISSAERGAELVKQILSFSRKTNHEKHTFSPHLIVKEAVKMLRATLPTTIIIEEDIDQHCGVILADPTNINQIVVNLCTNALHAMKDEKGTLSVSLRQRLLEKEENEGISYTGHFVVLTVSDTGHGMDKRTLERIYEPYFTTKEMGKGTGLGLAVIHGIVQDYDGFVRVESTVGKGSSFSVYLPVLHGESDIAEDSLLEAPEADESLCTGDACILVVDDELLLARASQRQLERLGYTVTATTDSSNALEQVRRNPDQFDLIITDQTMPGLTGAELVEEVKKIRPDIPVILCTGHSRVFSKEDSQAMGIQRYIAKPVVGNTLVLAVRSVLDEVKTG